MFNNPYTARVYDSLEQRNPHEAEFLQAVREVLTSLEPAIVQNPLIEQHAILERITEPDRQIKFRVTWEDDDGRAQVNRAYRVEFNNAIGPYKGGLRFHPSVNASIIKFLGFEQVFKNALTTLWLGGGKGGADFDPRGKSDGEVMRFTQAFMSELYRHIGPNVDVPAGDIGVGAREIGFMFGQYKRLTKQFDGTLTGKGLDYGGSLGRTEATGYGLCYYVAEVLKVLHGDGFEGKMVTVSGSGNVAIFAAQKANELGAKVVTMSDSSGYVHDAAGIDLEAVKQIKLVRRGRIAEYVEARPQARFVAGARPWQVPCDIALPCATQNELDGDDAARLIAGSVRFVAEGANMPCTPTAVEAFQHAGVIYGPGKAANAGGVAVSGLEMTQDAQHLAWTLEEVDQRLQSIMISIVSQSLQASEKYGLGTDLLNGANLAGFERVVRAMMAHGYV